MNKAAERARRVNRVGVTLTERERRDGRIDPPRGQVRRLTVQQGRSADAAV